MTPARRWTLWCALVLAACSSRGQTAIELEAQEGCDPLHDAAAPVTELQVYALARAGCAACQCGACFDDCSDDTCVVGCPGGACAVGELAQGLALDPARPGPYAVIIEAYRREGELSLLVASACVETTLTSDDRESQVLAGAWQCCSP